MSSVLKIVISYILSVFVCVLVVSRRKGNQFLVTSSWPEVEVPGVSLLSLSLFSLFTFARTYFLASSNSVLHHPSIQNRVCGKCLHYRLKDSCSSFSLLPFMLNPPLLSREKFRQADAHTLTYTQTHTPYFHFGIATDLKPWE